MIAAVAIWWGLCALMMAVCMVVMLPMMGRARHGHSRHGWDAWQDRTSDPERTLASRLSRGEIDTEEYHRLLEALRAGRSTRA